MCPGLQQVGHGPGSHAPVASACGCTAAAIHSLHDNARQHMDLGDNLQSQKIVPTCCIRSHSHEQSWPACRCCCRQRLRLWHEQSTGRGQAHLPTHASLGQPDKSTPAAGEHAFPMCICQVQAGAGAVQCISAGAGAEAQPHSSSLSLSVQHVSSYMAHHHLQHAPAALARLRMHHAGTQCTDWRSPHSSGRPHADQAQGRALRGVPPLPEPYVEEGVHAQPGPALPGHRPSHVGCPRCCSCHQS